MITEDLNWSTGRLLHPQVKLAACGTSVCREVERVHAAVLGGHVRSRCMLPLEMYLEEGIPLVCYLRHQPHAELVETSEQSMHAFLSISNANAATPALKVACHPMSPHAKPVSLLLLETCVCMPPIIHCERVASESCILAYAQDYKSVLAV